MCISPGLVFTLNGSDPTLDLSNSSLTLTFTGGTLSAGDRSARESCPLPQVCGGVSISRGQYYWEVDVCNSALYRIGEISPARLSCYTGVRQHFDLLNINDVI